MQTAARKAVVILSGGLDSTTCMGIAKAQGYSLFPLTFDYGQRHRHEIDLAKQIAEHYGVSKQHRIIALPFLKNFGASALTDFSKVDIPQEPAGEGEVPVTYVPGRNLMFLSIAASYAEAIQAEAIYIGVNALDYSGYPDCRPDFIQAFRKLLAIGTKAGDSGHVIQVETPLIDWTKADIIREGLRLDVPYHLTTSCYNGGIEACGVCDSCRLRLKGFREAGSSDPIKYRAHL